MALLPRSFLASSKVKMQFVPDIHGKKYPNPTTQYNLLLMKVRSIKKTSTVRHTVNVSTAVLEFIVPNDFKFQDLWYA